MRRVLLSLLFLLQLPSCKPTPEELTAAAERAIAASRTAQPAPTATDAPLISATPTQVPEAAPVQEGLRLLIVSIADGREPFMSFQATALRVALRSVDGLVIQNLDARGDAATQLKQLRGVLSRKPAYLLVDAVQADSAFQSVIHDFSSAGTQVVSVDERLTGPDYVTSLYSVQKELGKRAADSVLDALRRKAKAEGAASVTGRVLHLLGDETGYRSAARAEGFTQALAAEPGVVVVHEVACDWDSKLATAATEEALRLQKQFDVVAAQSDFLAVGASQAISAAQLRDSVFIVGMDALGGEGGGIQLIAQGVLDASVHHAKPMKTVFDLISAAQGKGGKLTASPPETMALEVITAATADQAMRRVKTGQL